MTAGAGSADRLNLLVLSEVFPPSIGGSGELLWNVYRRLPDARIRVLADAATPSSPETIDHGMVVGRVPMRSSEWGLLRWSGLRHHLRQTATVRRWSRRSNLVVHCARALPEGVSAWLSRRAGGARYLCWAHGEDITASQTSREHAFLVRRVLLGASAVIANSRNTAALLGKAGMSADRIDVVYPGVDASRFRPGIAGADDLRGRLADGGAHLLLTVGRLQRRKGHDLTLKAVAVLRHRGCDLRYVIVGEGDERARLEHLADELQIKDAVRFVGAVPAEELPLYYAAADIFCHPNRIDGNDIEGFGIVFLEAAAAGLPVIGGSSGGVPEAVDDGRTGLLVSGQSVDELVGTIGQLVSSRERGRAMGLAGRARVLESFSWERAAAQVGAIHRRVIQD